MFPGETVLSQKALGMPEDPHAGPFKVTYSGSGLFYIGTMVLTCGQPVCEECREYGYEGKKAGIEIGYNSRETDYFKTEAEAVRALEVFNATGVLEKRRT